MTSTGNPGTTPHPAPGHLLHVEDGLERLMGDHVLYRQLLRRFRQDYQDAVAQMRHALCRGDTAAARRKAHTLKGAAGMIGAPALHQLARQTEAAFDNPGLEMQADLELLEDALEVLLRALDCYLHDTTDGPGTVSAPPSEAAAPEVRALLLRLAQLLDDGDGAAIDVLEQSATLLAAGLGVAVYQEVAGAAHEYDFEGALEALQASLPEAP